MARFLPLIFLTSIVLLVNCNKSESPVPAETMQLTAVRVGTYDLLSGSKDDSPIDQPLVISFTRALDINTVQDNISLTSGNEAIDLSFFYLDSDQTISARPVSNLLIDTEYVLKIGSGIQGTAGETFPGLDVTFKTYNPPLTVAEIRIDDQQVVAYQRTIDVSLAPKITIKFSEAVPASVFEGKSFLTSRFDTILPEVSSESDSVISFQTNNLILEDYEKYRFYVSPAIDFQGKSFDGVEFEFYTKIDSSLKFPEITDEELLTKVQEQTFRYFWDFGHPTSGLARERNTSGETVTIGGSGFGVMSIVVGIERGFITRTEGISRLSTIINFLLTKADRFHGVWSHWLNGTTGKALPFSTKDDGGDLVETAFMAQALLTVRQYLDAQDVTEAELIDKINTLWNEIEWDWYTQGGQNVLYWHWSPNYAWEMNHKISGWNEALIVYVLAAASPTHTIDPAVYSSGWANNGGILNSASNTYYGYTLDMRSDRGGPLFFSHYSFLGLDPRNLEDQYANYWHQNVSHTQINRAYCLQNPLNYVGYHSGSWGLTASDNHNGYSAHSPENDLGVITPTAALSSIPYTPEASMEAIRFFYYILGDRIWGEYGFYDAFNVTEGWYASSYLAIDQGPIICMIENHRTGLLWDLFMSAPEVQQGLDKLGFTY